MPRTSDGYRNCQYRVSPVFLRKTACSDVVGDIKLEDPTSFGIKNAFILYDQGDRGVIEHAIMSGHIVVFSGGSAANNLVDVFGKLAEDKGCSLS